LQGRGEAAKKPPEGYGGKKRAGSLTFLESFVCGVEGRKRKDFRDSYVRGGGGVVKGEEKGFP